jgi:osmotically-inducible protein OsmY
MKIKNLSAWGVLLAGPLALLAACAKEPMTMSTPSSSATDRQIEASAKGSYNFHAVLEDRVTASASGGNVTLTGTVQDEGDKALAADTVENIPGVVNVNNQIAVTPIYPEHSDAWMAFKIHSVLLVKANVSAINTKVVVTDGNVILTGTADNLAQKELTGVYAKDIVGVKAVENDITVADKPAGETVGENIDDASITTEVRYALLTHDSTSAQDQGFHGQRRGHRQRPGRFRRRKIPRHQARPGCARHQVRDQRHDSKGLSPGKLPSLNR